MTLGRLIELYKAEQEGKQIMMRKSAVGFFASYQSIEEIKISDCELSALLSQEEPGYCINFFIKDEEDKHGHKIKTAKQ